ncbi:MAG: FHA domain-containing protein [Leptolyngbyaceae cyanobacterium]
MSGLPVLIRLSWDDPATGTPCHSILQTPVAIGREADQMPDQFGLQAIAHLELAHKQVSRYHALITVVNNQLHVTDKSVNGTFLNGRPVQPDGQVLTIKDTLRVGPFKITVDLVRDRETNATEINLDHSRMAPPRSSSNPNTTLIWLAGAGIFLLLTLGTVAIARILINQARPELDPDPSESSLQVPQNVAFISLPQPNPRGMTTTPMARNLMAQNLDRQP